MDRMSALKDKLKADLTASMKSRDEVRTRTIRMALAAVNVEEVSGKTVRELSDDEILKVLAKEAKSRREAAEAFSGAGRVEQAQAERSTSMTCCRLTCPPSSPTRRSPLWWTRPSRRGAPPGRRPWARS